MIKDMLSSFSSEIYGWIMNHGPAIIAVVLIGILINYLLSISIRRTIALVSNNPLLAPEQAIQRAHTLGSVLEALSRLIIFLVAGIVILQNIGVVNINAAIAGVGFFGIALGLATQGLARDFISGFFILFENQYSVGERIKIGQSEGMVEYMSLRTTHLRNDNGEIHIIPHGEVKEVINESRGWSRAVVDIGISSDNRLEDVQRIVQEAIQEAARDPQISDLLTEVPQFEGIQNFNENVMNIRVSVITRPIQNKIVEKYLRAIIKNTFEESEVDIVGKP